MKSQAEHRTDRLVFKIMSWLNCSSEQHLGKVSLNIALFCQKSFQMYL